MSLIFEYAAISFGRTSAFVVQFAFSITVDQSASRQAPAHPSVNISLIIKTNRALAPK